MHPWTFIISLLPKVAQSNPAPVRLWTAFICFRLIWFRMINCLRSQQNHCLALQGLTKRCLSSCPLFLCEPPCICHAKCASVRPQMHGVHSAGEGKKTYIQRADWALALSQHGEVGMATAVQSSPSTLPCLPFHNPRRPPSQPAVTFQKRSLFTVHRQLPALLTSARQPPAKGHLYTPLCN